MWQQWLERLTTHGLLMRKVLSPEDSVHVILIEHDTTGIGIRDNVELSVIPVGLKVDLS